MSIKPEPVKYDQRIIISFISIRLYHHNNTTIIMVSFYNNDYNLLLIWKKIYKFSMIIFINSWKLPRLPSYVFQFNVIDITLKIYVPITTV